MYGDGALIFEGLSLSKIDGFAIRTIDEAAVRRLLADFDKAGFYSRQDYIQDNNSGADFSERVVTITTADVTKRVYHYTGNPRGQELLEPEERIFELTNTAEWFGW
jgi:hypothetical protein